MWLVPGQNYIVRPPSMTQGPGANIKSVPKMFQEPGDYLPGAKHKGQNFFLGKSKFLPTICIFLSPLLQNTVSTIHINYTLSLMYQNTISQRKLGSNN